MSAAGLLRGNVMRWQSLAQTPRRVLIAAVATFLVVVLYWRQHAQPSGKGPQIVLTEQHGIKTVTLGTESFENIPVSGYANTKIPNGLDCSDIKVGGQEIAVTKSIYLEDDLLLMAKEMNHPMIDYSSQPSELSFEEKLRRTWGRMAGSSVWLEKYQVYFTVSRVFFYTQGVKHWPKISFIRAQVYDENWNHLDKYVLEWLGQNLTYPQILSIPCYFDKPGGYYGPEDPRITIEPGVPDAEPVIVFNVVDKLERRSMSLYRPFSNFTTPLIIEDEEPLGAEKNWSPFFMPQLHPNGKVDQRFPNPFIHFVYDYHPLQILRCHLLNGFCRWAYKQDQSGIGWDPYTHEHEYPETPDVMRGGTNFVPVPYEERPGLTSFVGFPRTHTSTGCGKKEPLYRPVIMLLTTNGTHYWLDYASDYLDFGSSILTPEQSEDPCDKGRILLGNGIARYEHEANRDIMTVSFTVADSTVQVAKLHGIRKLFQSLPQMRKGQLLVAIEQDIPRSLNVTHDLLVCSVKSVSDFAIASTPEDFVAPTEEDYEDEEEEEG